MITLHALHNMSQKYSSKKEVVFSTFGVVNLEKSGDCKIKAQNDHVSNTLYDIIDRKEALILQILII